MSNLLTFEQETVIRFDEETHQAEIYVSSSRVAKKLIKHGLDPYKTTKNGKGITGWFFSVPSYAVILKPSNSY